MGLPLAAATRDFKLLQDNKLERHELPDQDIQWNRIVELDIVPHPDRDRAEITERDYGMKDGVLHLKLRAAMTGKVVGCGCGMCCFYTE